jgi:hypothetical protein
MPAPTISGNVPFGIWEHDICFLAKGPTFRADLSALGREPPRRNLCRMVGVQGATHFLMRRGHKVATEIALNVLAYNMKRIIAILGCATLLEAMQT